MLIPEIIEIIPIVVRTVNKVGGSTILEVEILITPKNPLWISVIG